MNETFRIEDDEEAAEELKPSEANFKLLGIEESQRRQSIMLIENNFKSIQMNAGKDRNKSSNNMDDFLENELLPDEYLLDDYMPETANATLQQHQLQHNSILDVDELNLFADHSPSISNLNWLNSKIDDEKSNFTRKLSRPIIDFKAECRLVLNELLDAVSHKLANESTNTSTSPGLYFFLLLFFFILLYRLLTQR